METNRHVILSLISHTNVGKTTLARTLLRQEVGEIRDEAHVTDESVAYTMIQSQEGFALKLWDTPGFGDTPRLLKRLKISKNPVSWILIQVWDRIVDRALWCSQQAVKNVKDEADVVLYLVNATERPEEATYVDMEMEILTWIGKPVLLLMNQTGPPGDQARESLERERWKLHLEKFDIVRDILSLDAFARCWVQEGRLLSRVKEMLPESRQATMEVLAKEWKQRNFSVFNQSIETLGRYLTESIQDKEILPSRSFSDRIRRLNPFSRASTQEGMNLKEQAMSKLAQRLADRIQKSTEDLIHFHDLKGEAAEEINRRLQKDYMTTAPTDPTFAGLFGGFVSGAVGGLLADLASGGLTFGGGTVVGGFLGAAGAAGLAKGYNLVRGKDIAVIRWTPDFIEGLFRSALLRYLAVAHFGRGRGDYTESEHPLSWQDEVADLVSDWKEKTLALYQRAGKKPDDPGLTTEVNEILRAMTEKCLIRLYPESAGLFHNKKTSERVEVKT